MSSLADARDAPVGGRTGDGMARIGALEAGGTKMVLSVGTPEGEVLEREEIPTQGPHDCVDRMVEWFARTMSTRLALAPLVPQV